MFSNRDSGTKFNFKNFYENIFPPFLPTDNPTHSFCLNQVKKYHDVFSSSKIIFEIHHWTLNGRTCLVRTSSLNSNDGSQKFFLNWLLAGLTSGIIICS